MSASATPIFSRFSGTSWTVTSVAGTRSDTFASAFSRRTAPSTAAATSYTAGSAPSDPASSSSVGHADRCTDPSRHHDHTSSVT